MIPKKIYQKHSGKHLPECVERKVEEMLKLNPDYEYQRFDDEDADQYVHDNFGKRICRAYDRINIKAAKCDFWRYLLLYKEGGIYLDMDAIAVTKLSDVFLDSDEAVVSPTGTRDKRLVYLNNNFIQWALVSMAGHSLMKYVVDKVVDNIENKRKKNIPGIVVLTGPAAWGQSVIGHHNRNFSTPLKLKSFTVDTNLEYKPDVDNNYRILGRLWHGVFLHKYPGTEELYPGDKYWCNQIKRGDKLLD